MAQENINIYVTGHRWDDLLDLQDCNFFNTAGFEVLNEELDLKPFIINHSGVIDFLFDEVDIMENGSGELQFKTEELKFVISNIKPIPYPNSQVFDKMSDFFRMYQDNTRVKWLVVIHDNLRKENIWAGVIYPKAEYSNDNMSIEVTAYGIEREFADYYNNKKLNGLEDFMLIYSYLDFRISYFPEGSFFPSYLKFAEMLPVLFNTSPALFDFDINCNVGDWNVNARAYYTDASVNKGVETSFVFLKGGYYSYYLQEENKYAWFKKTCNAMGWQWFFKYVGDKLTLFVVPRSRNTVTDVQEIPYSELNPNWKVAQSELKEKFDYVLIKAGTIEGGDNVFFGDSNGAGGSAVDNPNDLKGERAFVLSDVRTFVNRDLHFNILNGANFFTTPQYFFQLYAGETETEHKIKTFDVEEISGIPLHIDYGTITQSFSKDKTVNIDVGMTDTKYIKYDNSGGLTSGFHYDIDNDTVIGDDDLVFKANHGECLYQTSTVDGVREFFTYKDYIRSDEAKLNFIPLLNSRQSIEISMLWETQFNNPYKNVEVTDSDEEAFKGREFFINRMTLDYLNNKTSFEVIAL